MTEVVADYKIKPRIPAEPNGCEVVIHFGDREVYRLKLPHLKEGDSSRALPWGSALRKALTEP